MKLDVNVRRCGRTPGKPLEKLVESLAKLHIAPLRRVGIDQMETGRSSHADDA